MRHHVIECDLCGNECKKDWSIGGTFHKGPSEYRLSIRLQLYTDSKDRRLSKQCSDICYNCLVQAIEEIHDE